MPKIDSQTLEKEIREIVAEIIEIAPDEIALDAEFVEDLDMDSMMALEILASIEKKYKLKIPEEYLTKVSTLSNLIGITKKFLEEK